MPKIRVLPDILASQVAAGEVVERPASVVKELVENAIDAGAKEICVDIHRGGSALIRVMDDGCGMSREDAQLSLERHATSKLKSAQDLSEIRTLGFRGEAVPSIASVSRFRMITREYSSTHGTEIVVQGGKLIDVKEAGAAPGTMIEAQALFFNMPARRKFMRAETTEAAHVEHQLRLHALASPQIRFRFRRDDQEVFDFPAVEQALDRVRQLLGRELSQELIPIPETKSFGLRVVGFVLPAHHAKKGRRHQCVFLNARPVEDPIISRAIRDGFRGAVAAGLHPAAWIWLEMNPNLVDVNVHPAKKEVRFRRPQDIKDLLTEALSKAMCRSEEPSSLQRQTQSASLPTTVFSKEITHRPVSSFRPPSTMTIELPDLDAVMAQAVSIDAAELTPDASLEKAESAVLTKKFREIGMLHDRFSVLESADGLVLFDPKAAIERIYYENFMRHEESGVLSQILLVPIIIELDPRDLDMTLRARDVLEKAGIEIDAFGGNSLQLRSLPQGIGEQNPKQFLSEWLDECLHGQSSGARFTFDRLGKLMAKRHAASKVTLAQEISTLLDELFCCELPYCAPDGRPTLTEFSLSELQRRFGLKR